MPPQPSDIVGGEGKSTPVVQNIQALFAPEYSKPGFGETQTDFLTA